MLTCPNCGVQNDYSRTRCFRCQAELAAAAPPEWTAAADSPVAPPAPSYVAQVALTDRQQAIVNAFSLGPGCPAYFWTRATPLEAGLALAWLAGQAVAWTMVKLDHSPLRQVCANAWMYFAVMSVVAVLFIAATGGRVRRQRWERLPWRDFEQFRKDEATWGVISLLCAAVYIVFALALTPNLAQIP